MRSLFSAGFAVALTSAVFAGTAHFNATDLVSGHVEVRTAPSAHYTCPMHPDYHAASEGTCPSCGMALVRVKDDSSAAPHETADRMHVSAERRQRAGVKAAHARFQAGTRTLRLFGRVVPEETRVFRVNVGIDGYVRQVAPITTGTRVAKDQWLATYSSPELRQPIQAFLVSLDVLKRSREAGETGVPADMAVAGERLAADRLMTYGMSPVQLDEIRRTHVVPADIKVGAPAGGVVVSRTVTQGEKFDRGTEFFRIADLDHVGILVDVSPDDAAALRPGQAVVVRVPGTEQTIAAHVSAGLPQADAERRALQVRIEADNPDALLRPGMAVDVQVAVEMPAAVLVPAGAVLDTGLRTRVFVEGEPGQFEPRDVRVVWRTSEVVALAEGVRDGESVAAEGTFLLDAESRLRTAQGH